MRTQILLDVDGVVADLHTEWCRRWNALTGRTNQNDWKKYKSGMLMPHRIETWDIHKEMSSEESEVWWGVLSDRDLYRYVQPCHMAYPGAVGQLREIGDVTFVTSCPSGQQAQQKVDWLIEHGFIEKGGPRMHTDVIVARKKYLVAGDYLVDDYPGNLINFRGQGILMDAPYNEGAIAYPRVNNLSEAIDVIRALEARKAA